LQLWAREAEATKIPVLKKFAYRLLRYRSAIVSYYDNLLSTGPVEAFNKKNKNNPTTGLRVQDLFKLKVYASHDSKYKLVG
jgi:transposase